MEDAPLSKVDEAQEAEALRRVISAYLNYSAAAEQDIGRWERSFEKLKPSHKSLLPNLRQKFEALRRCLKINTYFIDSMLLAFVPPFEMGDYCGLYGTEESFDRDTDQGHDPSSPYVNGACQRLHQSRDRIIKNPSVLNHDDNWENLRTSHKRQATECPCEGRGSGSSLCGSKPCKKTISVVLQTEERSLQPRASDNINGTSSIKSGDTPPVQSSACLPSDDSPMDIGYRSVIWFHPSFQLDVPPADVDKVRCIIRNIVRDWTDEGATERAQCYTPILEELQHWFPDRNRERRPSCLIPGAGLARLACEISRLGFVSQGNEFSYYMMICSSFILNHTQEPLEWVVHPWIHSNCNNQLNEDQLRGVRFPDLHPGSAGITEGFSMCAGDFVEVYCHPSQAEAWDAVVTCFFIDTAHNILEYLEIIARILKPGGVWINLGPLLYHFADALGSFDSDDMSVELSLDDVQRIAGHYGLKWKSQKMIETTYSANIKSMMQNRYLAAFWTMVKEGTGSKGQPSSPGTNSSISQG